MAGRKPNTAGEPPKGFWNFIGGIAQTLAAKTGSGTAPLVLVIVLIIAGLVVLNFKDLLIGNSPLAGRMLAGIFALFSLIIVALALLAGIALVGPYVIALNDAAER